MKHKHHDMICAKAANMELVAFRKDGFTGAWHSVDNQNSVDFAAKERHFLCLPQHKDVVLAGLNGAELEWLSHGLWLPAFVDDWCSIDWYMTESDIKVRVKPRKEKRWIAYEKDSNNVYGAYKSEQSAIDQWPELQIFKIEVEVN